MTCDSPDTRWREKINAARVSTLLISGLAMHALLLAERHIALLQLRASEPQPEVLVIEWSYSLISLMSAFERREIVVQRKTEIT
jgi:hypothetical protein